MLFTLAAVLGLSALSANAQAPTAEQLALVDAQYVASGFASESNTGLGVPLQSKALLEVAYPDFVVENGSPYTADQVAEFPTLTVSPAESDLDDFTDSTLYTVMLADAAALGDPDLEGNYRHYLANSAQGTLENGSFVPSNGTVITDYAGPGPLAGNGVHRYAWLIFTQGSDFAAPADLSSTTAAGHWNVSQYVDQTDLTLVAASFFTVVNGDPTGSVVETTAVNTATLSVSSAVSSAASSATSAASSGASAASSATSSAGAAATSAPASGANKVAVSFVGALAGVVGMIALA